MKSQTAGARPRPPAPPDGGRTHSAAAEFTGEMDSLAEQERFEPSADNQNLGIFARTLRLLRLSPPHLDTMGGYYGESTEDASRSVLAQHLPGAETHPEGAASCHLCFSTEMGTGQWCVCKHRVNQSVPRSFMIDCNGARGQTMLSANSTISAARGTLAGDVLWLAVIAGVFAIIVLN